MSRVVFTEALGNPAQIEGALGLGRSLKLIGDSTPRFVVTDQADAGLDRCFQQILAPLGSREELVSKLQREGARQILYLAPEYLAFKRLGPLFDLQNADDGRLRVWSSAVAYGVADAGLIGVADRVVGKLDLDVRTNLCRWVERGESATLLEPHLFRPEAEGAMSAYVRQLRVLEELDRYELRHGFGYVSPLHKLRRSLEKRILKLQGRL